MKKILFILISVTLLLASAPQENEVQKHIVKVEKKIQSVVKESKTETGDVLEMKQSKRESMLEAELARKEVQRAEKALIRETKLKKLDADLARRAEQRSSIVY